MRIIKLFLMVVLCISITSCTDTNKTVPENHTIIAIYPFGTNEETYYLTIDGNELNVKFGTKDDKSITNTSFMKNVKSWETKQLSNTETERVMDILDKLYTNDVGIEPEIVFDSWKIQIYYNGEIITQNCSVPDYEEIDLLIEEIKAVSPIEIDLHSWA